MFWCLFIFLIMKTLSEVGPGFLDIQIKIQAVCTLQSGSVILPWVQDTTKKIPVNQFSMHFYQFLSQQLEQIDGNSGFSFPLRFAGGRLKICHSGLWGFSEALYQWVSYSMTNLVLRIHSFILEKILLAQRSVLNSMGWSTHQLRPLKQYLGRL